MASVTSIAALQELGIPTTDLSVVVLGYYSPGDGGGGTFFWSASSTAPEDKGTIFTSNKGSGRWKRLFSGAVSVKWFGARGDNSTDDTSAIRSALLSGYLNVFIPTGTYLCSATSSTADCFVINGGSLYRNITGEGNFSVLKAKTPMKTLLSYKNSSACTLSDFRIECGGLAQTGIDTSYSSTGPSQQSTYRNIVIYNYTYIGWIADNNNDSRFVELVFNSGTTQTVALRSRSSGGALWFTNCTFLTGKLQVCAQTCHIVSCVISGLLIDAPSDNIFTLEGCYMYSPGYGSEAILIRGSNVVVRAMTIIGSAFYMNNTYAFNCGGSNSGDGALFTGIRLDGCLFALAGSSSNGYNIFGPNLRSWPPGAASTPALIAFSNCFLENAAPNETPQRYFNYAYEGTYLSNSAGVVPVSLNEQSSRMAALPAAIDPMSSRMPPLESPSLYYRRGEAQKITQLVNQLQLLLNAEINRRRDLELRLIAANLLGNSELET